MTATTTYRKTKTGEWVLYGPADALKAGWSVLVTSKGGGYKLETPVSVGQPFTVDGVVMVYGYLTPRPTTAATRTGYSRGNYSAASCADCELIEDASDGNGCARHRGNPRV